jgi:hypothetical protein
MLFRNQLRNSRVLMPIGMLCLVMAIVWPRFFHAATRLGQDWGDGLHGLLYGLAIGINVVALVLAGRERRREAKPRESIQ